CGGRSEIPSGSVVTGAASTGFENAGVGDPRIVALDGNVHVVLEGQFDSVLKAEIKLAVMDQLVNSRGVHEVRRLDGDGLVGLEQARERPGAASEIVFGESEGTD